MDIARRALLKFATPKNRKDVADMIIIDQVSTLAILLIIIQICFKLT